MVMQKNHEGEAVFEMLNKALELARREERVTEERSIKILIAQMHVVKVITLRKTHYMVRFRSKAQIK